MTATTVGADDIIVWYSYYIDQDGATADASLLFFFSRRKKEGSGAKLANSIGKNKLSVHFGKS